MKPLIHGPEKHVTLKDKRQWKSSSLWWRNVCFLTLDNKGGGAPLLFARWGKRNVSYLSKANKNGSVLGDMLVWDKLPLTPWIFQVTFNWKWTIQFSGGSLLPFPLPASPTRHPQWVCLVREKKTKQVSGCFFWWNCLSIMVLLTRRIHQSRRLAFSEPEHPDLLMEMCQYEGGSWPALCCRTTQWLTRRQWRNIQSHK